MIMTKIKQRMKTILMAVALAVTTCAWTAEDVLISFINEDRAPMGAPVELGVWNGDLDACKAKADKEGVPMIAIWSNKGCAHCEILEKAFRSDYFREWAKTSGMVLCFTCSEDEHGKYGKSETSDSKYYWFCKRPSMLKDYPFVRFYWYVKGVKIVDYSVKGDTVDGQQGIYMNSYDKAGKKCVDYIMQQSGFGAYIPKPSYLGGYFDALEGSLQADGKTSYIDVSLVREETEKTSQKMTIAPASAGRVAPEEVTINWALNQTNQTYRISGFDTKWYAAGTAVELSLLSDKGEVMSSARIDCIATPKPGVTNPQWVGAGELTAGDWTMDIAQALDRAQKTEGALTLAYVYGSLWDKTTDKTLLESAAFKAWVATNDAVLVEVDVPPAGKTSPCLLSKESAEGAAFMCRNMITDAQVEAFREKTAAYADAASGTLILLDENGVPKGRLTGKAIGNALRLDELKALLTDANEEANNTDATPMVMPQKGSVSGNTISAADPVDVFALPADSEGSLQKFAITTEPVADVTLKIVDENGDVVAESTTKEVSATIPSETCYLFVEGSTATSFKADAATDTTVSYTVTSSIVILPQEKTATYESSTPSDKTVVLRVEKDVVYRLIGCVTNDFAGKLSVVDGSVQHLYVGLVSEDISLELDDDVLTYQRWAPGEVGFSIEGDTVNEQDGQVAVFVKREGGSSRPAKLVISLDTADNMDGRFETFTPVTIEWADGQSYATNFVVTLKTAANRYDGDGTLSFVCTTNDCFASLGVSRFDLTVKDIDTPNPGKLAFSGAEPFFSKPNEVIIKEGTSAVLYVERSVGNDDKVDTAVTTTKGTLSETTMSWENHDSETIKPLELSGLKKGETATVTLSRPTGGATLGTVKSVKVSCVAADAPEFSAETCDATTDLTCYVISSNSYSLAEVPEGKVSVAKISGTLPSGLKAAYSPTENALVVSGAPTKAGVYTVVFQVKDGAVAGLTQRITFNVIDPTKVIDGSSIVVNPSVVKSRTLKDLWVLQEETESRCRLLGLMQVTIPTKGNVSAKLAGTNTVSFTTKNWSDFNRETGSLTAELTAKGGYAMTLVVAADGSLEVDITKDGEPYAFASHNGKLWSRTNSAADWVGYQTVKLASSAIQEGSVDTAPTGDGYLSVNLPSANAASGKVAWAGVLPNGVAVSGSTIVSQDGELVVLPLFKKSTADLFSGAVSLAKDGTVEAYAGATPTLEHTEKKSALGSYSIGFDVIGGRYDAKQLTFGGTSTLMADDTRNLGAVLLSNGVVSAAGNGLSFKFTASTGLFSGSFKSEDGKTTSTFKGMARIAEAGVLELFGAYTNKIKLDIGARLPIDVISGGKISATIGDN